jgi:hypothetical protein
MAEGFGTDMAYVPRRWRVYAGWLLKALGVIVILNLAVLLLRLADDPATEGPAGSSLVTEPHGQRAWHDLLIDIGRSTERTRAPFPEVAVERTAAVVAITPDPSRVGSGYGDALLDHAEGGGLVITTPDAPWFGLLVTGTELDTLPNGDSNPGAALPVTADVQIVTASGSGSFTAFDGAQPLLTAPGERHIAVVKEVGDGLVVAVSDISLLSNEFLAKQDNAAFAVAITDDRQVVFDEYINGFTSGGGLLEAPAPVQVMLLVLAAAAILWMWAVGARFGPPEQRSRHLPMRRARYIEGVGNSLIKTTVDEGAYGELRLRGLRELQRQASRHTGLTHDAPGAAAEAAGLTASEVAALEQPITSETNAKEAAAAVAKLERRRLLASRP